MSSERESNPEEPFYRMGPDGIERAQSFDRRTRTGFLHVRRENEYGAVEEVIVSNKGGIQYSVSINGTGETVFGDDAIRRAPKELLMAEDPDACDGPM